ncbi:MULTISPECIES: 5-dehydro-4-deoxyglucarate dehydratase [Streptomyces]|uniref:5-dehydro-4-deoxyglucarate dehydratase n=2 Tax=Streptomyces TaxID=1883 RepID=A0ACC4W942_STRFR|nr:MULTISPECIES: 5-dehydro-4-deoxyglucarate dehydratase [Streptomyces]KNE81110.1 5-dehydro-4-deoxyglucarate dehydratase [Streptomyces fradiae]OFA54927.1 5-dehydro-4-deoxyglucarate dehydratase [Streptomyces fradiae]PQM21269.1 5-dehydro-4-deoxyglucarate dehydratase [Streptomyces xinghaiensis]RKM93637.1 5-dehydro-4-deoxyglucarate dehydratase [Streptomyces xinghaiensis]RNC71560.1 5-dehydro-4-deoxyglucarate dehydratase [Streptomyces xinghaiensis]
MTQSTAELNGLLAFPFTPFTDDLELNLDAFAGHVEFHVAAGAGALFVGCGTGEFSSLAPDELNALVRKALDVTGGRVPVWAGAGGGAATARAGVAAAAAAGADGVLLLPPYLVTGPPAGLVAHVRYAAGGTGVPLIVYHRATSVLTEDSAVSLLSVPSVIGIKDGHGDIERMSRIVTAVRAAGGRGRDLLFFNGLPTAEMSARAYAAIGVERYSSAVHGCVPEIAQRFHRALSEGDGATMDTLLNGFYLPLVALRDETPGFAVSLVKAAARLRGQKVGPVRPPLAEPTDGQLRRLERIIDHGLAVLAGLEAGGR